MKGVTLSSCHDGIGHGGVLEECWRSDGGVMYLGGWGSEIEASRQWRVQVAGDSKLSSGAPVVALLLCQSGGRECVKEIPNAKLCQWRFKLFRVSERWIELYKMFAPLVVSICRM